MENPEVVDPIYQSLSADQKAADAAVAATEKELEDSRKQYDATKPMEKMRIQLRKEIYQKEAKLGKLRQRTLYLHLSLQKRTVEARQEYDRAYRAKEQWPDPDSFKRYQATQRLKDAPSNWSTRVPKAGAKPITPPPATTESHGSGH